MELPDGARTGRLNAAVAGGDGFFVPGRPVSQGSKTVVFSSEGRPRVIDGRGSRPRELAAWRDAVAQSAFVWVRGRLLEGPVAVDCAFFLPRPRRQRTPLDWPTQRASGDVDKLARAVLDALSGVAFADDVQVVELRATKQWAGAAGEGVLVAIRPAGTA